MKQKNSNKLKKQKKSQSQKKSKAYKTKQTPKNNHPKNKLTGVIGPLDESLGSFIWHREKKMQKLWLAVYPLFSGQTALSWLLLFSP